MIRSCKLAEIYAAAAAAALSAAAVAAEAASAAKLRIAERKEKDRIRMQLKRNNATGAEKEAWKAKNTLARKKARTDLVNLAPEKAEDTNEGQKREVPQESSRESKIP